MNYDIFMTLLHFRAVERAYEIAYLFANEGKGWSRDPGLNRGPTVYETVALPAELSRHPAVAY